MEFSKVEEFLRAHLAAAMLVAVAVAPATWAVSAKIHAERLAALEERAKNSQNEIVSLKVNLQKLNEEVAALREAGIRRVLRGTRVDFPVRDLFTPSPNVVLTGGPQ